MNRSILGTQLWELWRRTRNDLLQRVLIVLFLVVLIHGGFYLLVEDGLENGVLEPVMSLVFGVVLLGTIAPLSLSVPNVNGFGIQGIVRSQFVLPISAVQIVAVPLAFGVLASALFLGGVLLFMRLALGLDYHVLVTMGAVLPVAMTVYALVIGTRDAATLLGFMVPVFVLYAFSVFSIPASMNFPLGTSKDWAQLLSLSHTGYLTFYGVAFMSIAFALWSVRQMRHEAIVSTDIALSMTLFRAGKAVRRRQPFASPLHAQWWFEIRRVAGATAVNVVTGLLIFCVMAVGMEIGILPQRYFSGAALVILLISQLGILMGNIERVSGMSGGSAARRFSVFEATQGIGVAQALRLKIIVVLIATFLGSAVLAGTTAFLVRHYDAVLLTKVVGAMDEWLGPLANTPELWLAATVLASTAMLTVVLLSFDAVYLQRRASARVDFAITVCSVTIIPAYGILFLLDRVQEWDLTTFWAIHAWAIGVYVLFLVIRGLWRAWRHELLGLPTFLSAIGLWLAFVTTVVWVVTIFRPDLSVSVAMNNLHLVVFFAGLLSIPLGSVAWAPLALDGQRSQ